MYTFHYVLKVMDESHNIFMFTIPPKILKPSFIFASASADLSYIAKSKALAIVDIFYMFGVFG